MKYADLHLHTIMSDGLFTPTELVGYARQKGFAAIAVTDHDTVAGQEEALRVGRDLGVEVIPGIELSTLDGEKEIHILGYFVERENEYLKGRLAALVGARQKRAALMVERLNDMGYGISLERVQEIAGGDFVGRPHIARALVEEGYVVNIKDAFSIELIGRDGAAYVGCIKMDPREGIELVLRSGGVPVLAHPGYLNKGLALNEDEIRGYVAFGLQGIEVFYSRHSEEQVRYYEKAAAGHGLLMTGGSDCHGDSEELLLGTVRLPYSYVEALKRQKK